MQTLLSHLVRNSLQPSATDGRIALRSISRIVSCRCGIFIQSLSSRWAHSSTLINPVSIGQRCDTQSTMHLTGHSAAALHQQTLHLHQARQHIWAPPASTHHRQSHSQHNTCKGRQHCQTVHAIHIDRRQHLELAWKRQQERDSTW